MIFGVVSLAASAGTIFYEEIPGSENLSIRARRKSISLENEEGLLRELRLAGSERIVSLCITPLEREGEQRIIYISGSRFSRYGHTLHVLDSISLEEIYREDFAYAKPHKVQAGEVNGDGFIDVAITMYKKTEFHPVMAKRPYFYSWKNGRLEPLWRGSRFAYPFLDFRLEDLDGNGIDEVIVREKIQGGAVREGVYRWQGFGFVRDED